MRNTQKGFIIQAMIAIVLILTISGGGYVYLESKKVAKLEMDNKEVEVVSTSTDTVDNTTTPPQDNPFTVTSSEIETEGNTVNNVGSIQSNNTTDLWSIIDKETLALKNKDVESYKKLNYRQFTTEELSQFDEFIPFLLNMNSEINKNDYVNKQQDEKQAIYSTDLQKDNTSESYGYKKGIIMFINDKGTWKVLSKNEDAWSVTALTTIDGPKRTQAEADKSLNTMIVDTDKDGLTDNQETCSGASEYNKKCIKTDPNKKDTDGDGLWDGINKAISDF